MYLLGRAFHNKDYQILNFNYSNSYNADGHTLLSYVLSRNSPVPLYKGKTLPIAGGINSITSWSKRGRRFNNFQGKSSLYLSFILSPSIYRLIGMRLIPFERNSDFYLNPLENHCQEAGMSIAGRSLPGIVGGCLPT